MTKQKLRARDPASATTRSSRTEAIGYPRPLFLIVQLQSAIMKRIETEMRGTRITPAVGRVLNAIATRPQISASELARIFNIAPQSIKQSIAKLEDEGLITRSHSSADLRVLGVALTEKGWAVRERHQQVLVDMYGEVFGAITPREMDELARILVKVLRSAQPSALDYYAEIAAGEAISADG